tara:strand:+ start:658 stop:777 length:120 start_codon:yes stop_codon:yes gene_type:complete
MEVPFSHPDETLKKTQHSEGLLNIRVTSKEGEKQKIILE